MILRDKVFRTDVFSVDIIIEFLKGSKVFDFDA